MQTTYILKRPPIPDKPIRTPTGYGEKHCNTPDLFVASVPLPLGYNPLPMPSGACFPLPFPPDASLSTERLEIHLSTLSAGGSRPLTDNTHHSDVPDPQGCNTKQREDPGGAHDQVREYSLLQRDLGSHLPQHVLSVHPTDPSLKKTIATIERQTRSR